MSAIIRPSPFNPASDTDIGMVIVASLLLFLFLFVGKEHLLVRWQGISFIVAYVLYVISISDAGIKGRFLNFFVNRLS